MLGIPRTCCFLLPLLPLLACQSQPHASLPEAQLLVMSYNIHHGEGVDGVFDLQRIAEVIKAENPVLVALQEVDSGTTRAGGVAQDTQLAALTGMYSVVFGEAIPYAGGSYGDAVLSRWPLVESRTIALGASPQHEKRVAVVVVVEEPTTGRQLRFVGTHLDHTTDPADRIRQAQQLNQALLPATMPTLLVGDLNAQPDSQPMQVFFAAGWQAADVTLQPTFPSTQANIKIDWFLRAPGQRDRLTQVQVLSAPLASDHCPLIATWIVGR